ncbi:permease-like cell division protein FtsX [Jatrophihabitans fulvus]
MRANFVLSGVWEGIRRNLSMTIALVLNTAILLTFVSTSVLANREIDKFSESYEGRLNVSVYLCSTTSPAPCTGKRTSQEQTDTITKAIRAYPDVTSASYVSEKEQFQRAREVAPQRAREFLTPGIYPASFTVKLKDIRNDYVGFKRAIEKQAGVSAVATPSDAIQKLLDVISNLRFASIIVAFIVLIASVLLIANTVQVAAAQRKNETSIMRLVGASRWMTELPFVLETIIATIVGSLAAFGMVLAGKYFLLDKVFAVQVESGVIPNLDVNDVLVAGGISLIAGVALAALTAFATLRLYVKL